MMGTTDVLERLRELTNPCGKHDLYGNLAYEKVFNVLMQRLYPETDILFSLKGDFMVKDLCYKSESTGEYFVEYPESFTEARYLVGYEGESFFSKAIRHFNPFFKSEGRIFNPIDMYGEEYDSYDDAQERLDSIKPRDLVEMVCTELLPLCDELNEVLEYVNASVREDPYEESYTNDFVVYESKDLGTFIKNKERFWNENEYRLGYSFLEVLENPYSDGQIYSTVCWDGVYRSVLFLCDDGSGYGTSADETLLRPEYFPSVKELFRIVNKYKKEHPDIFE